MGFFSGIKRAFGFSDNGEEHDDELDGVDGSAARSPFVNPFKPDANDAKPAQESLAQVMEPRTKPSSTQQSADVAEGIMPMSQHKAMKKDEVNTGVPALAKVAEGAKVPEALIHDIASVLSAHMGTMVAGSADSPLRERLKQSENERRALQSRYNTLAERASSLEGEVEHLELDNKALQNKLKVASVQSGASADGAANSQVESIAQEYKEKMELTNALLNDLRSEAARKAQEVEELKAKLQEAQLAGTDGAKAVTELNEKLAQLESQLKEQESIAATDAKSHADALAAKDVEIEALKAKMATKEQEMVDEMEGMLKEVEDFKQKKTNELAAAKHSSEDAARAADEAKEQLLVAQNEKTKLSKQLADLNRRMADIAERHNQRDVNLANQIDQLKTKLKQAEKLIEERVDALDKATDTITALEKERDALSSENKTFAQEYELLRKEYEGAKLVHEQIREENDEEKRQVQQLHEQLAGLSESVEAKDAEIALLRQRLERAEAEKNDVENVTQRQFEDQISGLEKEVKALSAENGDLRQANGVLELTIDSLSVLQSPSAEVADVQVPQAEEQASQSEAEQVPQAETKEMPQVDDASFGLFEASNVPVSEEIDVVEQSASQPSDAAESSVEISFDEQDDAPGAEEVLQQEALSFEPAPEYEPAASGKAENDGVEPKNEETKEEDGPEIDDFLDDIDWLVPSPPSKKVVHEPEPEPEPERKIPDSRQMSLF